LLGGTDTGTAIRSPKLEHENTEYGAEALTTRFGGTVFTNATFYWFTQTRAAQAQTNNKQTNKISIRTRPGHIELQLFNIKICCC
jgi:hypothetical protein